MLCCVVVEAQRAKLNTLYWNEQLTSLDTSSRTLFVGMCVHVTSNVELRNNVRLLLNVELRNYVISRQIVERRVTSECYLNIAVVATVKINLKRIKKKENLEQFNLDMLKDEHMRQQYAVEVNNIFDCLEHEVTEQYYEKDRVDILWTNIKEGIQKAAHNILPNIVKKNKKPWISTDILDMMEKRKKAKNTQSYDEINRQVKRACKIAKENWLEEQCQEIENLENQHLTRQMHEKIRRVTNRRKTTQTTGIMDKHDNMCFEKEALVNVWIEYMGELYADDRVSRPDIDDESGPSITLTEVKHAINKLKNKKATGTDLRC